MLTHKRWSESDLADSPAREPEAVCPPVDIFEDEREVVLEAELPGVSKEAARVSVEGDELTIHADSDGADIPEGYAAVYLERKNRSYRRVFALGPEVRKDGIHARYENGILRVVLPKAEKAQPRRIAVG